MLLGLTRRAMEAGSSLARRRKGRGSIRCETPDRIVIGYGSRRPVWQFWHRLPYIIHVRKGVAPCQE